MNVIKLEKEVIDAMIKIYCRGRHSSPKNELCEDCRKLKEYSFKKLDNCPFKERKPSCRQCTIHCYEDDMRQKIREVMRYSGPKLLSHAPLAWLKFKLARLYISRFKKIGKPIKGT